MHSDQKHRRVGLVGTGIMGLPMARHLHAAGLLKGVHTRTKSKANQLLEDGVDWYDSPAELVKHTDTIITVVSDSPDVEMIYLNSGGVCAGDLEGMLCIDMSTVAPETAVTVSRRIEEKGGRFVDAPVSGGKTGAESGTLSIMVGGDPQDVRRAQPLFDLLGSSTVHCGPIGHGQLTKMCNQIICGLNLLAVSEAVVAANRAGLDPSIMLKAVSSGAAGSWAVDNLGTRMVERDFEPMFMVDLQQKDLRIALRTAESNGTPLPGTALVSQLLASNQAVGEGRKGTQVLVRTIERLAGL